jgi:integrase
MAPATEYGYRQDFLAFGKWCEWTKRVAMPATPETVSLFLADQLAYKKVTTVYRYSAAIAYTHIRAGLSSPVDDSVHQVLRGARRMKCEQRRQMSPLTVAHLGQIAAELTGKPTFCAVRNLAILLTGFSTGLRRSNLCWLRMEDVTFYDEGVGFYVRREKQDRQGAGRSVCAPFGTGLTCPVRALVAWLDVRGREDGALFSWMDNRRISGGQPLSSNAMGKIITKAIVRIGLKGLWGPHSLRAGIITASGLAGASHLQIGAHVGHSSPATTAGYFRPGTQFKGNVAGLVGL